MTFESVTLRPFQEPDFDSLASWIRTSREAIEWGGPGVPWPIDHRFLNSIKAETTDSPVKRLAWTAVSEGRPVGHVEAVPDWHAGSARLCRLVVAPTSRRAGIAKTVIGVVVGQLFAAGFHRLELNVYSHNRPAVQLYKSAGFLHEGRRHAAIRFREDYWNSDLMAIVRTETKDAE